MPSANAGNEMPDTASVMPRRSGQRLRHTADTMPMIMPITTDHDIAAIVSQSVGMKRSPISVRDGTLGAQRLAEVAVQHACRKAEELLRQRLVEAEILAHQRDRFGVASAPAARRAGSPGSRCTNRNTSTPTISSVGSSPSRRLTIIEASQNQCGHGRGYGNPESSIAARPVTGRSWTSVSLQIDFGKVERRRPGIT